MSLDPKTLNAHAQRWFSRAQRQGVTRQGFQRFIDDVRAKAVGNRPDALQGDLEPLLKAANLLGKDERLAPNDQMVLLNSTLRDLVLDRVARALKQECPPALEPLQTFLQRGNLPVRIGASSQNDTLSYVINLAQERPSQQVIGRVDLTTNGRGAVVTLFEGSSQNLKMLDAALRSAMNGGVPGSQVKVLDVKLERR